MLDAELLGLLNASLDAEFTLRDKELAKEIERTKNGMALQGLGRSSAVVDAIGSVLERELLVRHAMAWDAFSRALKAPGVVYSDELTGQIRNAITDRVSSLAQRFNADLSHVAHLSGVPCVRTVDDAKQAALGGLAMHLEFLAREHRPGSRSVLRSNKRVERVEHYVRADTLRSTADVEALLQIPFDHPEQALFVYEQEDQPNAHLMAAVDRGDLLIESTEWYFIQGPPGLFRRIDPNTTSPHEKADLASGPKYLRHTLSLSAKKRREMEASLRVPHTVQVFNAPVGIIQTGTQATASLSQTIDPRATQTLLTALTQLVEAVKTSQVIPPTQAAELIGVVEEAARELEAPRPNSMKVMSLVSGAATTIQTIASLQPFYEALKTALAYWGVALP